MDEAAIGRELGESGFTELVAAFYRRVQDDDVLRPLYPEDDWSGAEKRLRDFLIFRFGLSERYIEERGHPRLRMRHAPFAIGIRERDRWMQLMKSALQEVEISDSASRDLESFFQQVADFMRNRES